MQTDSDTENFAGQNTRTDAATAEMVERGVEFNKTLGKTVATAYFKEKRVPDPVIERILSASPARRGGKAAASPRY